MPRRNRDGTVSARGEPEFLQRLAVELDEDRLGAGQKAHLGRPFQIGGIPRLEVMRLLRHLAAPEALIFDVALQLPRIDRAGAAVAAIGAAPARQQADPGTALVIDDVVGIEAGIFRRAVGIDQSGQLQPRAELDQHVLERPYIAVGLDHRLANGVGGGFRIADRAIEQRNAIVALEISGIGQDQVGDRRPSPNNKHRNR